MAEFTLPPEMDAFAEAAGDAAMGPFQGADFAADPGAAFSEGMGAAMDFMADAGMPPDMMANIADVAQGCFDAHMAANPDSPPMDAFDAVGGGLDMYMADFPADMPCMDMAGDMPPMPDDFAVHMDDAPPYGDFDGGPNFDAGAMPDAWEPGPMTDMGPGGPGDMGPGGPGDGPAGPGDMGPGGPGDGPAGPGDMGPGGPGDMGPAGPGDMGPAGPGDMGPAGPGPDGPAFGPDGEPMGPPPGEAPNPEGGFGPGPDGPLPGSAAADGPMGPPGQGEGPEGPDPLFGDGPLPGSAAADGPMGPPPGDFGGDGPGGAQPTDAAPDAMGDMHTHMDDAGAHQAPEGPAGPGPAEPMPGDMPADMPPPPDDTNDGGEVV